ncbi:plasmid recombination protein [Vibrio astriarenae]
MYQFIHFESYSLSPSKRRKSLSSIVNEMMRKPCAIPHIEKPKKPKVLYGFDAYAAESAIRDNVSIARDRLGRKLRKDAQVALCGVMSLPITYVERYGAEKTKQWIHANIKYLKDKYKENLLSVILHTDESHPHLHFIISIPRTHELGKANLAYIHEPFYARQFTDGGRKNKFLAYKKEYRILQDDYYHKVSSKFSLVRVGPKRQRLTRSQYKAQQHNAELLSKQKNDILIKTKSNTTKEKKLIYLQNEIDRFKSEINAYDEIKTLRKINSNNLVEKISLSSTVDSYKAKIIIEKEQNRKLNNKIEDLNIEFQKVKNKNKNYEEIIDKIKKGNINIKSFKQRTDLKYE